MRTPDERARSFPDKTETLRALFPPNHILRDTMVSTSTLSTSPLTLPPSANPAHFADFGRQVEGVDLETADDATLAQVCFLLSLRSTPTAVSGWTH